MNQINHKAVLDPDTARIHCQHKICVPNNNQFRCRMHNEFEIFLFLRGDVNYIVEQNIYPLEPGDILIFNSTELHYPTFRSDAEYERIVLHFNPALAHQLSTSRTQLLHRFLSRPQGEGNLIRLPPHEALRCQELALRIQQENQHNDEGDDILAVLHLAELLVLLNRGANTDDQLGRLSAYVHQTLSYISATLPRPMSLSDVASALSVDRFYLDKLFRKEMGTTIYNYVLLRRLNLARLLLAQGYSVGDACTGAGFNDYSNFIRTFKKYTGITPARFARSTLRCSGAPFVKADPSGFIQD